MTTRFIELPLRSSMCGLPKEGVLLFLFASRYPHSFFQEGSGQNRPARPVGSVGKPCWRKASQHLSAIFQKVEARTASRSGFETSVIERLGFSAASALEENPRAFPSFTHITSIAVPRPAGRLRFEKPKRGCAVFGRLPGRRFSISMPRTKKKIPPFLHLKTKKRQDCGRFIQKCSRRRF